MRGALNFLVFEAGWLVCVLQPGAAALAVAGALVVLHFVAVSRRRIREALFVLAGGVCGILLDSLWRHLGVLAFHSAEPIVAGLIPAWLVALWILFLTTLNHSLAWVGRRWWTRWLLPAPAGALTYYWASRLDALDIGHLPWGLVAIALGWLVLYPVLVALSHWLVRERGANEFA